MWSGKYVPEVQRNLLPPSSGQVKAKFCSKMLVPSVLSEETVWPSYVVFVLHNPMPNSDEVEILSHSPDFVY